MSDDSLKDFFGTEICEGDVIVYPGRGGSSLWMSLARVREVHQDKGTLTLQTYNQIRYDHGTFKAGDWYPGVVSTVRCTDRVVVSNQITINSAVRPVRVSVLT